MRWSRICSGMGLERRRRSEDVLARVKDALLIVPAFHVFTCFVYLFFYYGSFGGGLVYFANAADVFSVSLGDVAPAYAGVIIGTAMSHAIFRDPKHGNAFFFDTLDSEEQQKRHPSFLAANRIIRWGFFALSILPICISVLYFVESGFFPFYIFFYGIQFSTLLVALWALNRFDLTKTQFDFLITGALVFLSLIGSGLSDAQIDKALPHGRFDEPRVRCESSLILRNVSDYFLVVNKDNSRSLVDKECEARFQVIAESEFRPLPDSSPAQVIGRLFFTREVKGAPVLTPATAPPPAGSR